MSDVEGQYFLLVLLLQLLVRARRENVLLRGPAGRGTVGIRHVLRLKERRISSRCT